MMSMRELCERFVHWRNTDRSMVLATVVATAGSTYSKAGAQMLIADGADYQGLLSGGCLEGDLTLHAQRCLESGRPHCVNYDMRNREEDEIWGLGLGCDGALDILLQPLSPQEQWQPFATIADAVISRSAAAWALVVDEQSDALGSSVVLVSPGTSKEQRWVRGISDETFVESAVSRCRDAAHTGVIERLHLPLTDRPTHTLVAPIHHPVRLLLIGAGPDTLPVLAMASQLGWYVTQADHRPGHLEAAAAGAPVDHSVEVTPGRLREHLDPDDFDAVVIMSHHLASDRAYLEELALSEVPFIGLLGPAPRRRRLLADVTEKLAAGADRASALRDARALKARTYGPVGLDLGAREPAAIALSIIAQVQQFHARNR